MKKLFLIIAIFGDFLNEALDKMTAIASGYRTFISTGLLTTVSIYASTKGFDVTEIQTWLESLWSNVNSLIVALGGLTAWFRALANKRDE